MPRAVISDHDVYEAVKRYVDEHGISPTLRELAKVLGVVPSTVMLHLRSLRKAGVITYSDSSPRTARVVGCLVKKPSSEAGAA